MTKALPTIITDSIAGFIQKKADAVQYGPIGIDFSANGLRMVQFRKSRGSTELHAVASISFDFGQPDSAKQLRITIKHALKEDGFVGRDVVTCLPPEEVKIMMLSYLHEADKKDEELIVQRIAERIDGNIENYVIDYMMVRPDVANGQERSVLVALADHDQVVAYLEKIRKADLVVKMLEIEPTAIRRLVSIKHGNEHDANLMIISMGKSQTYITVLSGRRLIYERDIDFGEVKLIELLCRELDIDAREARIMLQQGNTEDDAAGEDDFPVMDALFSVLKPMFMELVEDINRALIYAASETRGLPVKHVYLTNQVASWCGIESFINTLIEVPVSVLSPFDGFNNANAFKADSEHRSAVATGMALHGFIE